ncbi:hypothetical protein HK099_002655 [Clydaea vesicula]|uniref:Uncharacterized protein n=1 Tax=Clydaea vesicula TaxID=447962 RepID=A0AAD5U8I5_9FUNG|nr:hypothetical protein HK099_002655 [Clydaea vesicula]
MNFLKSASFLILLGSALSLNVENQYIVKLKNENLRNGDVLENHLSWLNEVLAKEPNSLNSGVLHKYGDLGNSFSGYAVKAPASVIDEIKKNNQVEYVEADGVATTLAETWGIDRVDQRALPLDGAFNPSGNGEGITVYVIDTGITAGHPQFEGRASEGAFFAESDAKDGNGHGTHCAGSVASKDYGVAKKAKVVGVKVLSASGSGSWSGVIAGINWVASNATPGKSVASMSLGGGKNQAVNDAVDAAAAKNIPFAVAAGNSGGIDACNTSPAGATGAYTVAASDKNDAKASFTDLGPCVEIVAPGVGITSTWLNNGVNTISGTSMATPHVAGGFAALLSQQSFSSAQDAYNALTAKSTPGKITGLPANTVNKLLYVGA